MTVIFTILPARAELYVKVGLLSEPENFNPFRATDAWTKKVLRLVHQPLYLIDPSTQKLIPWLAVDQPIYNPQGATLIFHLREMQWDDGTEFGAEDVVFTAEVFKKFQIPRYYTYWEFVKKIEALDKRTVKMTLDRPMATLYTQTLTSWIVQKRKWQPIVRKANGGLEGILGSSKTKRNAKDKGLQSAMESALKILRNHVIKKPTGLGPFKFKEWRKGSYILLVKNEQFFGKGKTIGSRRLGPYIDGVLFKIYNSLATATSALRKGGIDLSLIHI